MSDDLKNGDDGLVEHKGGCHCGAVQFTMKAPARLTAWRCNCTICTMKQNHHVVVPASSFSLELFDGSGVKVETDMTDPDPTSSRTPANPAFRLAPTASPFARTLVRKIAAAEETGRWFPLSLYTFGTHTAKHFFCRRCGICPFYIPRSNPDGVAVTVHCLDRGTVKEVEYVDFDGENWEQTIETSAITALSREDGPA